MRKSNAFTLLEVLIAMMIIAIALAAAVRSSNESIRVTRHVREVTVAHFVAMNILSEIQVNMLSLDSSHPSLDGKTKMLGEEWDWTATLNTTDDQFAKKVMINVAQKKRIITRVAGYV